MEETVGALVDLGALVEATAGALVDLGALVEETAGALVDLRGASLRSSAITLAVFMPMRTRAARSW